MATKETYTGLSKTVDPTSTHDQARRRLVVDVSPASQDTDATEYTAATAAAVLAATPPASYLKLADQQMRRLAGNTLEFTQVFRRNDADDDATYGGSHFAINEDSHADHIIVLPVTCDAADTNETLVTRYWWGIRATATATMTALGGGLFTIASITITNGADSYTTLADIAVANTGGTATLRPVIVAGVITALTIIANGTTFTGPPTITIPYSIPAFKFDVRRQRLTARKVHATKAYITKYHRGMNTPVSQRTGVYQGQQVAQRYNTNTISSPTWEAQVFVTACFAQATAGSTKYTVLLGSHFVTWPYRHFTISKNLYVDKAFTQEWTPNTVSGSDASDFANFAGSVNAAAGTKTKMPKGTLMYLGASSGVDLDDEGVYIRSFIMNYHFLENPQAWANIQGWRSEITGVDSNVGVGWVNADAILVSGVAPIKSNMPAAGTGGPYQFA